MQKNSKTANFEDVFPIAFLEDNLMVAKDGKIAIGYEMELPEIETVPADQYRNIQFYLSNTIKTLPVGTVAHFQNVFYYAEPELNREDKGFFTNKNIDHFLYRPVLKHKAYLFLCFPGEKPFKHSPGNTWFAGGVFKNPWQNIEHRIEQAENVAGTFITGLSGLKGFGFRRMTDEVLWDYIYQYFNLEFSRSPTSLDRNFQSEINYFGVGEKKLSVISLKGQGSSASSYIFNSNGVAVPMVNPITFGLQFPHIYNVAIYVCDQGQKLKEIDQNRFLIAGFSAHNQDNQIQEIGLENFTAEIRAEGKHLVELAVNVMVYDIDAYKLKEKIDKTVSGFAEMYGAGSLVENFDVANLYFSNSPGNGGQNFRYLITPLEQAACYLNTVTSFKSNEGILYADRQGNPVTVNLWPDWLINKNMLTVGTTGSGKSYNTNHEITHYSEIGDDLTIIDKNGSYKTLCKILGGLYFEYNEANPLRFNPFLVGKNDKGDYELSDYKANFLIAFLSALWKGAGERNLSKEVTSILYKILKLYYDFINDNAECAPSLPSFYRFFKSYHFDHKLEEEYRLWLKFLDVESFFLVIEEWVEGRFAKLLDTEHNMDISDQRMVVFDMEGIKENPELYPVISLLIIELVLDKIRRKDLLAVRKHIIMDEAWSMLSDTAGMAEFIMNMFRTVRKSNGAINTITQGIEELNNSPFGKTIIGNAAIKKILDHSTNIALIPDLQKHLGLTAHQVELLCSIKRSAHWAEFLLLMGEEAKVYRLELSPYAHAAFSSNPTDRSQMTSLTDFYDGNAQFATQQFVEEQNGNGI
ncbi:MAG: TraG family conjugative transposon ATPase [Cytophagales bacterium]|nr:TraG family conjugative transposon ATPase [Cytophagales bacterium]